MLNHCEHPLRRWQLTFATPFPAPPPEGPRSADLLPSSLVPWPRVAGHDSRSERLRLGRGPAPPSDSPERPPYAPLAEYSRALRGLWFSDWYAPERLGGPYASRGFQVPLLLLLRSDCRAPLAPVAVVEERGPQGSCWAAARPVSSGLARLLSSPARHVLRQLVRKQPVRVASPSATKR